MTWWFAFQCLLYLGGLLGDLPNHLSCTKTYWLTPLYYSLDPHVQGVSRTVPGGFEYPVQLESFNGEGPRTVDEEMGVKYLYEHRLRTSLTENP